MTVGSGVIASGAVGGGAIRSGLIGAGGVPLHRGLRASFVAPNQFYTWPINGSPTFYANAQSMFTWSSSTKWTRQSSGLWAASGTNTPAYEWDASGNIMGLRLEGARTNSCLWSDDLTNAAWVATNVTTAKTATGADGAANSATTLTATAGNGTVLQTFTSASATRQYGAFVKRRTGSGNIQMTVDNGTTWTTVTVTSDWTMVSINQTAVTNPVIGWRIVTSGDAIDTMWNQLENAATFTSSPIPTTTATVTRNADNVYTTTLSWANLTAFSWVTEMSVIAVPASILFAGQSFSSNASFVTPSGSFNGPSTPTLYRNGGASAIPTRAMTAITANEAFKGGGTIDVASTRAICAARGNIGTANTSLDYTSIGTQRYTIGSLGGSVAQSLFGHIRRVEYWPELFTDAQIAALTA